MSRPLPGTSSAFRPPRAGDLCVLLVSTEPLAPPAAALIAQLRDRFGGRRVEPLHVTCDRLDGRGDESALVDALARDAAGRVPVPVRATALMRLRRHDGAQVLKLVAEETAELDLVRAAVRRAREAASMTTAYSEDVAFTVSVLEDIGGGELPERIAPVLAFRGDRYLLSRFLDARRIETMRAFDFTGRA